VSSEATICSTLGTTLRQRLSGSMVFKHADMSGTIMPDFSVTWGGRTIWLEIKLIDRLLVKSKEAQKEMMRRLDTAGQAYYVVYSRDPHAVFMLRPALIDRLSDTEPISSGWNHVAVSEMVRSLLLVERER